MKPKTKWAVGLVAIAAVIGGGLWTHPGSESDTNLTLSGAIEGRAVGVGSRIGGRIAEVYAVEGQLVKAGAVLLRFEAHDVVARRDQAAAQMAQAAARLEELRRGNRPEEIEMARARTEAARKQREKLRAGPRPQEIARARADLAAAQAEFDQAQTDYRRLAQLYETEDVSRQTLDRANSRLKVAGANVTSARQRLQLLQEGYRPEDVAATEQRYREAVAYQKLVEAGSRAEVIAQAKARLEEAKARLTALNVDLAESSVEAPIDCVVEVLDVRPGDIIAPGAPVATLIDPADLWVRVFIPEPRLGLVHVGQDVTATVDSYPDKTFKGAIEWISQRAEFTPRNVQTPEERVKQVFAAKVALRSEGGLLRIGMPADVHIELSQPQ